MPWLFKQPGSANWWIGYRWKGQQFRDTTGTPERQEAETHLNRVKAMIKAKKADMLTESVLDALSEKALPKTTLFAEVHDWLNETKRATAEGTHARYRPIAEALLKTLKANEATPLLTDATQQQLRQHLENRFDATSPGTANLERKVLRIFFRRAVHVTHSLKRNPMEGIKPFRADRKKRRRPFTSPELKAVYENADNFWQYMVLGGFYTGLRLGDLVTLRIEDVDLSANMINREAKKTERHSRVIHIPIFPRLKEAIVRQVGPRSIGPLWPKQAHAYETKKAKHFSAQFYELLRKSLPEIIPARDHKGGRQGRGAKREQSPLSFHSLRHTFITLLKKTGASQAVAKELAGHTTDAINELYTHMPTESLIEAVSKLPEFTQ